MFQNSTMFASAIKPIPIWHLTQPSYQPRLFIHVPGANKAIIIISKFTGEVLMRLNWFVLLMIKLFRAALVRGEAGSTMGGVPCPLTICRSLGWVDASWSALIGDHSSIRYLYIPVQGKSLGPFVSLSIEQLYEISNELWRVLIEMQNTIIDPVLKSLTTGKQSNLFKYHRSLSGYFIF